MYSHSPSVSSWSGSFRFSSAEPEREGETLIAVNGGLGLWVHHTSHSLTLSLWLREALSHGAFLQEKQILISLFSSDSGLFSHYVNGLTQLLLNGR